MPTCSVCGRDFPTEQELQRHAERMHPGMMSGRGERVGERMPSGTTREEKKMGRLEEKEAKYRENEGEHQVKGQERMAERDRKKEEKVEEKMGKERAKETKENY